MKEWGVFKWLTSYAHPPFELLLPSLEYPTQMSAVKDTAKDAVKDADKKGSVATIQHSTQFLAELIGDIDKNGLTHDDGSGCRRAVVHVSTAIEKNVGLISNIAKTALSSGGTIDREMELKIINHCYNVSAALITIKIIHDCYHFSNTFKQPFPEYISADAIANKLRIISSAIFVAKEISTKTAAICESIYQKLTGLIECLAEFDDSTLEDLTKQLVTGGCLRPASAN